MVKFQNISANNMIIKTFKKKKYYHIMKKEKGYQMTCNFSKATPKTKRQRRKKKPLNCRGSLLTYTLKYKSDD